MYIKINISSRRGKPFEIVLKGGDMVKPIEARGHRSICTLLDVQDWDTAKIRLAELGVRLTHQKNKPVVNIEEVNKASKKWCRERAEK